MATLSLAVDKITKTGTLKKEAATIVGHDAYHQFIYRTFSAKKNLQTYCFFSAEMIKYDGR
ncbi:MAG: hypothetical protein ACP5VS_15335 [Desulfomonilaceae bacterium]